MPYDTVIIGAGPSGLAAALRLSHFGIRVCLLEAHNRLGGLNSWHFVAGREISSGLHAFTNYDPANRTGPLAKLLRQLRMKLSDLQMRSQGLSSVRFPSAVLRFSNDHDLIRQQIAENFPAEIDGFDRLRRLIRETDDGELTSAQTSARDVIGRFISNPLLVDMLFCPVMFYGNPGGVGDGRDGERSRPDMDWLLFCVVWKCIFESGLGYPTGGMRPVWERMAARIGENGGEVRLSARVSRLVARDGRVCAALLESGEEIEGGMFFSSAGGVETDLLLDSDGSRKPVGAMTCVEGICLLGCPPADAGMTDTVIFYSFTDELRFGRTDDLVEDTNGLICATGNYLPADGEGENIIKISQQAGYSEWSRLSPEAYGFAKHETAAGMATALGKLGIVPVKAKGCPGRFGIFDDLFTPMTIQRYTHHVGGAIYGTPVKTRTGVTACSNLFLIGADQGFHGLVGAMLSGVAMVNLHFLAKR